MAHPCNLLQQLTECPIPDACLHVRYRQTHVQNVWGRDTSRHCRVGKGFPFRMSNVASCNCCHCHPLQYPANLVKHVVRYAQYVTSPGTSRVSGIAFHKNAWKPPRQAKSEPWKRKSTRNTAWRYLRCANMLLPTTAVRETRTRVNLDNLQLEPAP